MGNTVKPITPEEISEAKLESMPDEVIEAFNELIIKGYDATTKTSKVKQNDVAELIVSKIVDGSSKEYLEWTEVRSKIFANGWLNVEDIYHKAGWNVSFDKAGYCETYDSFFEFKKRTTR